jgi:hypothetical protein
MAGADLVAVLPSPLPVGIPFPRCQTAYRLGTLPKPENGSLWIFISTLLCLPFPWPKHSTGSACRLNKGGPFSMADIKTQYFNELMLERFFVSVWAQSTPRKK